MRGLIVAVVMVAAGAANAQQTNWKAMNAAGAVAAVTASAAWCLFEVDTAATEWYLKDAGFDRGNQGDISGLELSFAAERQKWAMAGQGASKSAADKSALTSQCQQVFDGYGPNGSVRKGLISRK